MYADRALSCHNREVSDTIIDEEVDQRTSDGDHERFAHYVDKNAMMSSALNGHEVIALCGKRWIPNRDPQRFPVCPDCKRIYETLKASGR